MTQVLLTDSYNGGYSQELFLQEKSGVFEHFLCPLCNAVVRDPVSSGCSRGDFACEVCMKQYADLQNGKLECPKCHEMVEIQNNPTYMRYNLPIANLTQEMLWIKCPQNKNCNRICQQEMKLKDYNNHLKYSCPFVSVQCPVCYGTNIYREDLSTHPCLKGVTTCSLHSEKEFPSEEMKKHEDEEPNSIILCEWCKENILSQYIESHKNKSCPVLEIDCENEEKGCDKKIKRKDMKEHLTNDCRYRIVECPFSKWGCQELLLFSKLDDHLKEFESKHWILKIDAVEKRMSQFGQRNRQLEKQMEELKQTNQQMQSQIDHLQLQLSNRTMLRLGHHKLVEHCDDKIVVFESNDNPEDQNLLLLNSTQGQCFPWFTSHQFKNSGNLLMDSSNFRDIVWANEVKMDQLKYFGFPKSKLADLKRPVLSMLIKVCLNKQYENEISGIMFNDDQLLPFSLPRFNHIKYPGQLLFHPNLGLICADWGCFTKCEQLWITNERPKEKKKETKNDKYNNGTVDWVQIPSFENKKTDELNGMVICEMKKGWNELNDYCLFTHSTWNGLTAMWSWNNQQWFDLKDNTLNKHGRFSSMYQWKERNSGNVLVINGVCDDKSVSEFDMHKQEWLKLSNTNYFHYQFNSYIRAHVSSNKQTGLLTLMSYHTNSDRKEDSRAIVEILDLRTKKGWHVIKSESECLNRSLPFNPLMKENRTFCRILR